METQYYDLNDLLNLLPDNNNNLIKPLDLRNNIYSLWNIIGLNKTYVGSINNKFIGLHKLSDRFKFLLGKRTYNDIEVFKTDDLSSNVDFIFYNNKLDSNLNQDLFIKFLAGNNFTLFENAPRLIAAHNNVDNKINLNIINPNGFVSLSGDYIKMNNITFPNSVGAENDIMIVRKAQDNSLYLDWVDVANVSINTATLYSTNNPVPKNIGGIKKGTTYTNTDIKNVITDLLFKVPPEGKLYTSNYLYEYSANRVVVLNYEINKLNLNSTLTYSILPVLINNTLTVNPLVSTLNVNLTTLGDNIFKLYLKDNLLYEVEYEINIKQVLPFFVGLYNSVTVNQANIQTTMSSLSKEVIQKNDIDSVSFNLNGTNKKIYVLYPAAYGDLSEINISSINHINSFTKYTFNLSSPTSIWSNQSYNVYVYKYNAVDFDNIKIKISFK